VTVLPSPGIENAKWDAFVSATAGSTFCHLSGWREIMTDVMGHECLYAISSDSSGRWCGVLPLVRVKSRLLGHFLVSMPFLNSGGPVGTTEARAELSAWAAEEARRSRADLLELRSRLPLPGELRVSHRKITVKLPLQSTAAAMFKAFPAKLRSQVRRPQKEGLRTAFGLDHREAFYEVFARTMRTLGTPVLPAALFHRIAAVFPSNVEFGVVYRGDEPVAAGCGFRWGGEFELTWAGSLRTHARLAPNMLLYWAFMERMIDLAVPVFDFGRCSPGSGTHVFKKQWGGSDVELPWAQWSRGDTLSTPSPERPVFRLAIACWQRLPLAVTNRLGPLISTQLP
jgi:serine/alanine adding enzyme